MIFYYSSTGNSKYVASKIAEKTNEEMFYIPQCMKDKNFTFDVKDGESVGFVFPVYFFGMPKTLIRFIKNLKLNNYNNNYSYVVFTYGGNIGMANKMTKDILKASNIFISSSFCVKMPDNFTPIFSVNNALKIEKKLEKSEEKINKIANAVAKKAKGDFTKNKLPSLISSFLYKQYNRYNTTKFNVDDTCIGCNLCASVCPTSTIAMVENKPHWIKKHCDMCLSCVHHCPKFVISYGNKTKIHGQYQNPNVSVDLIK